MQPHLVSMIKTEGDVFVRFYAFPNQFFLHLVYVVYDQSEVLIVVVPAGRNIHLLCADLIEQFDRVLNSRIPHNAEETILYLTEIISFLKNNLPLYGVLFSSNNNDIHLLQRVRQLVRDKCSFFWNTRAPGVTKERMDLYTSFVAMGFIGVLSTWADNGMKEKPEEIAHLIMDLVLSSEACGIRRYS